MTVWEKKLKPDKPLAQTTTFEVIVGVGWQRPSEMVYGTMEQPAE